MKGCLCRLKASRPWQSSVSPDRANPGRPEDARGSVVCPLRIVNRFLEL